MSSPLLVAENVSWFDGDKAVVQAVSLQLNAGEIVTVIGPNGAGKSTLVKLLVGLLEPHQGRIIRRRGLRLGFMPQKLIFDATLPITAARFLALAEPDAARRGAVIERIGVGPLLDTPLEALSGGELQRLLFARALLRQPECLVMDEPAQGVDMAGQAEFYRLIAQVRDDLDCGVLMVSHDLHLVMARTDRVICLNHHVCCAGEPESVSRDPAYRALLGDEMVADIAVYTHHHDHHHDLHGDVIADDTAGEGCSHPHA